MEAEGEGQDQSRVQSRESRVESPESRVPAAVEGLFSENLFDLINRFIDSLKSGGLSKTTIRTYRPHLRAIARFLNTRAPEPINSGNIAKHFTIPNLKAYMEALHQKKERPRTRNCKLTAMRSFGTWLEEEKLLEANPALMVKRVKLDAATRKRCSDGQVLACLEACDRISDLRRAALAKAIWSIVVFTAVRRAELLALTLNDLYLDVSPPCLLVGHGKGEKSRKLPLHPDAVQALASWLLVRGACKHKKLWDLDHTRSLGDAGLRTLWRQVVVAADFRHSADCLNPHSVRHNTGTRMHRSGMPLNDVRVWFGHSKVTTTQIYLHVPEEELLACVKFVGFAPNPLQTGVIVAAPQAEETEETAVTAGVRREAEGVSRVQGAPSPPGSPAGDYRGAWQGSAGSGTSQRG